jgi:hypothetical protein
MKGLMKKIFLVLVLSLTTLSVATIALHQLVWAGDMDGPRCPPKC